MLFQVDQPVTATPLSSRPDIKVINYPHEIDQSPYTVGQGHHLSTNQRRRATRTVSFPAASGDRHSTRVSRQVQVKTGRSRRVKSHPSDSVTNSREDVNKSSSLSGEVKDPPLQSSSFNDPHAQRSSGSNHDEETCSQLLDTKQRSIKRKTRRRLDSSNSSLGIGVLGDNSSLFDDLSCHEQLNGSQQPPPAHGGYRWQLASPATTASGESVKVHKQLNGELSTYLTDCASLMRTNEPIGKVWNCYSKLLQHYRDEAIKQTTREVVQEESSEAADVDNLKSGTDAYKSPVDNEQVGIRIDNESSTGGTLANLLKGFKRSMMVSSGHDATADQVASDCKVEQSPSSLPGDTTMTNSKPPATTAREDNGSYPPTKDSTVDDDDRQLPPSIDHLIACCQQVKQEIAEACDHWSPTSSQDNNSTREKDDYSCQERRQGVDWRSLTRPACLPMETCYFPPSSLLSHLDCSLQEYRLVASGLGHHQWIETNNFLENPGRLYAQRSLTAREEFNRIVLQRLAYGFQLYQTRDKSYSPVTSSSLLEAHSVANISVASRPQVDKPEINTWLKQPRQTPRWLAKPTTPDVKSAETPSSNSSSRASRVFNWGSNRFTKGNIKSDSLPSPTSNLEPSSSTSPRSDSPNVSTVGSVKHRRFTTLIGVSLYVNPALLMPLSALKLGGCSLTISPGGTWAPLRRRRSMKSCLTKGTSSSFDALKTVNMTDCKLSIGSQFHHITLEDDSTINVTCYRVRGKHDSPRQTTYQYALQLPGDSSNFVNHHASFDHDSIGRINWSYLDNYLCYGGASKSFPLNRSLRFNRARFCLLPKRRNHRSVEDTARTAKCESSDQTTYSGPTNDIDHCYDTFVDFINSMNRLVRRTPTAASHRFTRQFSLDRGPAKSSSASTSRTGTPLDRSEDHSASPPPPTLKHRPRPPRLECFLSDHQLKQRQSASSEGTIASKPIELTDTTSLGAIAARMADPSCGLPFLSKSCTIALPDLTFIGWDAVKWLVVGNQNKFDASTSEVEQAIALIQNMIDAGWIRHASGKTDHDFVNGTHLYTLLVQQQSSVIRDPSTQSAPPPSSLIHRNFTCDVLTNLGGGSESLHHGTSSSPAIVESDQTAPGDSQTTSNQVPDVTTHTVTASTTVASPTACKTSSSCDLAVSGDDLAYNKIPLPFPPTYLPIGSSSSSTSLPGDSLLATVAFASTWVEVGFPCHYGGESVGEHSSGESIGQALIDDASITTTTKESSLLDTPKEESHTFRPKDRKRCLCRIDDPVIADQPEWAHLVYDVNYHPGQGFTIELQWLASTGGSRISIVTDHWRSVNSSNFNLVPIPYWSAVDTTDQDDGLLPADPFDRPFRIPLHLNVLLGCDDKEASACTLCQLELLLPELPDNQRRLQLIYAFQDYLLRKFDFINQSFDNSSIRTSGIYHSTDRPAHNHHQTYIHAIDGSVLVRIRHADDNVSYSDAIKMNQTTDAGGALEDKFACRQHHLHSLESAILGFDWLPNRMLDPERLNEPDAYNPLQLLSRFKSYLVTSSISDDDLPNIAALFVQFKQASNC